MNAVAIHALGRVRVARRQPRGMHAGLVQGELVDTLLGAVLVHERGVAVAAPAELGGAGTRDADLKAAAGVHRNVLVLVLGIAAVAGVAALLVVIVDVVLENFAHAFNDGMALEAGVFVGGAGGAGQEE